MENKYKYLYLELSMTLLMLYSLVALLAGVLSGYRVYLLFGLPAVFGISWFNRERPGYYLKAITIFGVVASFISIMYAILNSSFFYKDIMIIWIRGIFVLEAILGLNAFLFPFLSCIQVLSIPLFMSWPIFTKGFNPGEIIAAGFYLICWFAVLKIKFYASPAFIEKKSFQIRYSVFVPTVTFIASLFISLAIFQAIAPSQIKKNGIFPRQQAGGEYEMDLTEEEFYDLQNEMQDSITKRILKYSITEDRYKANALLSLLVKDSPDVYETKRAEEGLTSFLKSPGHGLENGQKDDLTNLLNNYIDKKVSLLVKRSKDKVMDRLRKSIFGVIQRISIFIQLNKMQSAQSYENVRKYDNGIRADIDHSTAQDQAKTQTKGDLQEFKAWKTFELYRKQRNLLAKDLRDLKAEERAEFAALASEIENIENVSQFREAANKIKQAANNDTGQHAELVKNLQETMRLKSEFLLDEKSQKISQGELEQVNTKVVKAENISELKGAEDKVGILEETSPPEQKELAKEIAEILDLKVQMLLDEKEKEKQESLKAEQERAASLARARLFRAILKAAFIVCLWIAVAAFIFMYFLMQREKGRLKQFFSKNPREFILNLAENAKSVLSILGSGCENYWPPLSYARLVQKRYSIIDDRFLKFIAIFEEAKYSQHVLGLDDSVVTLKLYNDSLKVLFSRHNKFSLWLFKYPMTVLKRKPLFIYV